MTFFHASAFDRGTCLFMCNEMKGRRKQKKPLFSKKKKKETLSERSKSLDCNQMKNNNMKHVKARINVKKEKWKV